jgi:hypothetical protein
MSVQEANSMDGEGHDRPTTTGTGCYKNYNKTMLDVYSVEV